MLCVLIFQVDLVAQGDSVYDIIDASDHFIMRNNLSTSTSLEMGELSEKNASLKSEVYIYFLNF